MRSCTSSPPRNGSATSSRTSGGRRRGRSWTLRRMASEGTSTVPRMGSFKRALFGYRREEVDTEMSARDAAISAVERHASAADAELTSLSGMVIEREREIRSLSERLQEANERHERSIVSLQAVSERLEEIEAQARGQATRIRMKALREAVEVGRRAQELSEAEGLSDAESPAGAESPPEIRSAGGNGVAQISQETFEGTIQVEIGPLGDYSQLVGIEDVIGRLGASEISI